MLPRLTMTRMQMLMMVHASQKYLVVRIVQRLILVEEQMELELLYTRLQIIIQVQMLMTLVIHVRT